MNTPTRAPRTRIAPSPTGIAHLGTLYMALFNQAFAWQQGGQFIVRIEDTDRQRYVPEAEDFIFTALDWAGIVPDESPRHGGAFGPYRQSERLDIYRQYADQLLTQGHAYYCFCSAERLQEMRATQLAQGQPPKYDRHCYHTHTLAEAQAKIATGEKAVVRLLVPDGRTTWNDLIRGEVTIDHRQIDDQVLLKSDGFPTYHLAVVVDDHLMQITHIIRGEEWISSTPKHLLLYQLLGWDKPQLAHMPLLRNRDKSKLSKRKNDVSILQYRDQGYLPEALLNYLMLLGWSHPDGRELLSLAEFRRDFTLERMQKTGPIFDTDKLRWMNGKYIREVLSASELKSRVQAYLPADFPVDRLAEILPLVRERLVTLVDIETLTSFFYRSPVVETSLLLKKATPELVQTQLRSTLAALQNLPEWSVSSLETTLRGLQTQQDWNASQYFMMLRMAATGQTATPPLFDTLAVLGREAVVQRMRVLVA